MKNKNIAGLIIGLCIVSVLLGVINNTITIQKNLDKSNKHKNEGKFSQLFNQSKLALITLEGPITGEADVGLSQIYSAKKAKDALKKALKDKSVKGILLRINSPGGTVGMSQEIYHTVMDARKKKPVVVSMADISASGGYYIASAADRIYANEGTLTGSIGVIMGTFDAHKLMGEKLGITSNTIKSGRFKDTGTPYRPMRADEKDLLQNIIDSTYTQFVDAITKGRVNRKDKYVIKKMDLTKENLKKYADGRIFSGKQALTYGFIDKIGGMDEAVKGLEKMAIKRFRLKEKKLPIVNYSKPSSFSELLYGISEVMTPAQFKTESIIPFSMKNSHRPLLIWE